MSPLRSRSRTLQAIKIATIIALVLLTAIWMTAPWWYTDVEFSGVDVGLVAGRIEIMGETGSRDQQPDGWRVETWDRWTPWLWWFDYESYSGRRYSSWSLHIPLWLPMLLLCGLLYVVRRLDHRNRTRDKLK